MHIIALSSIFLSSLLAMQRESDSIPKPQTCSTEHICHELITHFILDNTKGKGIEFTKATVKSDSKGYPFFTKITTYLRSLEPLLSKSVFAGISYINTISVLETFFTGQKPQVSDATTTYIAQKIDEILETLKTQNDTITSWYNESPIKLGLSPYTTVHTKNFFYRFVFRDNTSDISSYTAGISAFKSIFKKINEVISWYYRFSNLHGETEFKKITFTINKQNKMDFEASLKKINKKIKTLADTLESYKTNIDSNIISNQALEKEFKNNAKVEIVIIDIFINWLNKNIATIESLFPKQNIKKGEKFTLPCTCPFLATNPSIIKQITMPQESIQALENLLHTQSNMIYPFKQQSLGRVGISMQTIQKHKPLINDFLNLTRLHKLLTTKESNQHDQLLQSIMQANLQFTVIPDLEKVIAHIKRWSAQLTTTDSTQNFMIRWKSGFINWYKKSHYFFGFSLIEGPRQGFLKRKSIEYNRYSYMIHTLESLFKKIQTITDFYDITKDQTIITKLKELNTELTTYQAHFFEKNSLISFKPDNTKISKILANLIVNKNENALAVGIEYVITQKIIEWVKGNIGILENSTKQPQPLTLDNSPQTQSVPKNQSPVKSSNISPSSSNSNDDDNEIYFDQIEDDKEFKDLRTKEKTEEN